MRKCLGDVPRKTQWVPVEEGWANSPLSNKQRAKGIRDGVENWGQNACCSQAANPEHVTTPLDAKVALNPTQKSAWNANTHTEGLQKNRIHYVHVHIFFLLQNKKENKAGELHPNSLLQLTRQTSSSGRAPRLRQQAGGQSREEAPAHLGQTHPEAGSTRCIWSLFLEPQRPWALRPLPTIFHPRPSRADGTDKYSSYQANNGAAMAPPGVLLII